jgi:pimeloyl-ACP methyl ester carboxylesterase
MCSFDFVDQLDRVDCPVLVCVGELDPRHSGGRLTRDRRRAARWKRGGSRRLRGAGHFIWKDNPDRYWPIVTDFVTAAVGMEPREARV